MFEFLILNPLLSSDNMSTYSEPAERPNTDPPDNEIPSMYLIVLSGWSRSISLEADAPPYTYADAENFFSNFT